MLDYALNVTSPIVFVPLSNNTTDLPSSLTENRFARIEKYIGGVTVSVIARDRNTYVNTYTSGSWTGWDTYTTNADLKINCKSVEIGTYGTNEGVNNSFVYNTWYDTVGFYQLQFYCKTARILLRHYDNTTNKWTDLWDRTL